MMTKPKRYSFEGYDVECEHDEGKYCLYTYCEALEQELEEAQLKAMRAIGKSLDLTDKNKKLREALEQAKKEIVRICKLPKPRFEKQRVYKE